MPTNPLSSCNWLYTLIREKFSAVQTRGGKTLPYRLRANCILYKGLGNNYYPIYHGFQAMVIDFHTHYYPDKIAERALDSIVSVPGIEPATDGTRDGLIESMKDAGIDLSLGLPLANTSDNVRGINRWAALNNRPPVLLLGSIHPAMSDPLPMIEWIAANNLKGIKVHPEYQDFSFDDPKLFPVWESCIENDLLVLTHAGGDIKFSAPFRSNPQSLATFHRRFPKLKLVLAHMGSWGMWDEAEQHLLGLPVYLDLAFTLGILDAAQLTRMIRSHGADRVLFGTDSPWRDQREELSKFTSLPLTEAERELILWKNAAELLSLNIGAGSSQTV